jgi:hypothetical protein
MSIGFVALSKTYSFTLYNSGCATASFLKKYLSPIEQKDAPHDSGWEQAITRLVGGLHTLQRSLLIASFAAMNVGR